MRKFEDELGFAEETKELVALVSLGKIEEDPKWLCESCMTNDANFNLGFAKTGRCNSCKNTRIIFEIIK